MPIVEAYEVLPIQLEFKCTHGVWPKLCGKSMCYCTSKERAEFMAKALEVYAKHLNNSQAKE